MKKIILPIFMLSIGVAGCSKFLERKPLGQYTQDDLGLSALESQVMAIYAGLRTEGCSGVKFGAVHSIRSDDAMKGSIASDGVPAEQMFDDFNYLRDFWLLNDYWGDHYKLVKLCNDVIGAVDKISDPKPSERVNRAEAKFIRAYAYFNLVRAFGDIPKIDFIVTTTAEGNVPKKPVAEIYALIDADLTEAGTVLPAAWESTYIGRSTKWAAKALHAKTWMTRGNWGSALGACREIINSNTYRLYEPYWKVFTEEGENNIESIFEIQALYNATQDFGIQYANYQGVRGSGSWDLGWGWNLPTENLYNAFEPGDPRREYTCMANNAPDPYGINGTITSQAGLTGQWYNRKAYTHPNIRNSMGGGVPRAGRWLNMRIIRYADVLLWAAEAANELGGAANTTDALNWLEMIRARARQGAPAGTLPKVVTTDQAELREKIRHERRVEFGMEHERFYDLVRWGIAEDVFAQLGKNYQPRNRYLPIPQPEIDKSGGVLKQNPDY
ncbi:RagB/SusD family nutrient uptake outer membrane protein [Chitinophaga deserti]|uniref:RagB/SusD family nutrient uptake outer membrane protein n=1 Tax=Chitinophaga deserti TaxID=2164099 RepID=UPI000D6D0DC0|nr:RagB/SusD family nutrient uptake outer membrane protein [Chitinophaga deserti]